MTPEHGDGFETLEAGIAKTKATEEAIRIAAQMSAQKTEPDPLNRDIHTRLSFILIKIRNLQSVKLEFLFFTERPQKNDE